MRFASSFRRQIRRARLGGRSSLCSRSVACALVGILLAAVPALAEHTRWWRQDSYEDLDKGTAKGVALRSDGKLFLAPRFTEFADANLAYLLAMRADSKGNLYAAGGSNAKVLRLDATGKMTTVFESSELAAQALAVDANGNLYVGTSPDGKVYKVTPAGQSSTFFDPKTKYIWDLVFDKSGTLYVATGDTGQIFSVTPDGKGQLFYSGEESHIRALAIDSNGNILAGTEPGGLVLRITKMPEQPTQRNAKPAANAAAATPPGRAFVLYETGKQEITALVQDPVGNLYVAAVGEKNPASQGLPQQSSDATATSGFTITVGAQGTVQVPGQVTQNTPFTPFPAMNSSSVFRIAPDGSPEELWNSRNDLVYALGFLNGKLVLGAGNQGTVIELDGNHIFSRLVTTSSAQVTAFAAGPTGKLFLASGNPGKVFALGPDSEPEGTFESQAFDAHIFSRWGRMEWSSADATVARTAGPPRIEFYARSGNTSDPNSNWSVWAGPYSDPANNKVDCPAARFIQWKGVLRASPAAAVAEIDSVSVAYLPKNVAPEITGIALQTQGVRTQALNVQVQPGSQASAQIRMPPSDNPASPFASGFNAAANFGQSRFEQPPQGFVQKGYQSVVWTASDANDDPLEFAIYYRGENETSWKLLKDKLDAHFYSFDTTGMPDGAYYLKIAASDAPGNPPGDELATERTSDRFEVDNTPPAIAQLTADAPANSKGPTDVRVRFSASDPASPITRAQYSLDAGDWTVVFPMGGLSDGPKESYDFYVQKVAPGEHTLTVRVYDQFENVTSAKTTVRVAPSGN